VDEAFGEAAHIRRRLVVVFVFRKIFGHSDQFSPDLVPLIQQGGRRACQRSQFLRTYDQRGFHPHPLKGRSLKIQLTHLVWSKGIVACFTNRDGVSRCFFRNCLFLREVLAVLPNCAPRHWSAARVDNRVCQIRIYRSDIDKAHAVRRTGNQGDRRWLRAAVHQKWLVALNTVSRKQKDLVCRRIEFRSWLQNDKRSSQTFAQLFLFMPMGVIDEGSSARGSHVHNKRVSRCNGRRSLHSGPAPIRHAVVRTFELDSVPVNRCRLL